MKYSSIASKSTILIDGYLKIPIHPLSLIEKKGQHKQKHSEMILNSFNKLVFFNTLWYKLFVSFLPNPTDFTR
jgi:hypothetical protein